MWEEGKRMNGEEIKDDESFEENKQLYLEYDKIEKKISVRRSTEVVINVTLFIQGGSWEFHHL